MARFEPGDTNRSGTTMAAVSANANNGTVTAPGAQRGFHHGGGPEAAARHGSVAPGQPDGPGAHGGAGAATAHDGVESRRTPGSKIIAAGLGRAMTPDPPAPSKAGAPGARA